MSRELRHLIGQLMVCGFPSPDVDAHVQQLIREYHVGNIILFQGILSPWNKRDILPKACSN